MVQALEVKKVALAELHPDTANARAHPEKNMASIVGSLRQFGQVEPLVVQRGTGKIIGGNGRYSAMKALGWTQAEVVEIDIDNTSATALGIALNRTSELAEWDTDVLGRLLNALSDDAFDLNGIGFDDDDLAKFIRDEGDLAGVGGNDDGGVRPDDVAHVKMVQLFFAEDQFTEFMALADELAERYGTENITDTIMKCVEHAHAHSASSAA